MLQRAPEEVARLGIAGITRESFRLLRCCLGPLLLLEVALLILPAAVAGVFYFLLLAPLHRRAKRDADVGADDGVTTDAQRRLILLTGVFTVLVVLLAVAAQAAVVYTAGRVRSGAGRPGRSVTVRSLLRALPRMATRVGATFMWWAAVYVGFSTLGGVAATVAFVGLGFSSAGKTVAIVVGCGLLAALVLLWAYLGAVWDVAGVVCVVEEPRGVAALAVAVRLLRGRRWSIGFLNLVFQVLVLGAVLGYGAWVFGSSGRFVAVEAVVGVGVSVLTATVLLVHTMMQIVAYCVCKAMHGESVDTSVLADRLDAYDAYVRIVAQSQFMKDDVAPPPAAASVPVPPSNV